MEKNEHKKIWKIRTVKNYPEAHNHLFIGQVLGVTPYYIRLDCTTYHFGKTVNNPREIKAGVKGVRILPWNRIEIINELPTSFDYSNAEIIKTEDGQIALSDGKIECTLSTSYDNKY